MEALMPIDQGYDSFASLYNNYWHWDFHQIALQALEKLLLPKLPAGARILDVCCGTGRMAHELLARGFAVTGLDRSEQMLRCAKQNAPNAQFLLADASRFVLLRHFHGALSIFDSMNHILTSTALLNTFRNVHDSLLHDGSFIFDLNLEQAYRADWDRSCSVVDDTHAFIMRGGYDTAQRLAHTKITIFQLNGLWHRSDIVIHQRCHSLDEVAELLHHAGFRDVRIYDAQQDLGISGDLCRARVFVLAK
jgi:SAM-dependent methyltransferase